MPQTYVPGWADVEETIDDLEKQGHTVTGVTEAGNRILILSLAPAPRRVETRAKK
jgi:hypothetical protein